MDEKRYVREDAPASYPPPKGKVLIERVSISIRKGPEILFKKTYLGSKGRKLESFSPDLAVVEGYPSRSTRPTWTSWRSARPSSSRFRRSCSLKRGGRRTST